MTDQDLLRACLPYVPDELADKIHAALEKPAKRATRLPPDWRPSPSLIAWAKTERPDVSAERQVGAFVDYWTAKPGKDGCKLAWDATFRNWIRNCRSDPKPAYIPERPVSPQVVAQRKRSEPAPASPAIQALLGDMMKKLHINGSAT